MGWNGYRGQLRLKAPQKPSDTADEPNWCRLERELWIYDVGRWHVRFGPPEPEGVTGFSPAVPSSQD